MIEIGSDGNVVFVTGKANKYLVTCSYEDGLGEPQIKTGREIFDLMGMDDCFPVHIERLMLIEGKDLYECEFYGKRCCKDRETGKTDPLRMEIRRKGDETLLDAGYAPDH